MSPRRKTRRKPATQKEQKLILVLVGLFLVSAGLFHWHNATKNPDCAPECPHGREVLAPVIAAASHRHALSPDLVTALIWKESRFRSCARGDHGEYGLMQITDGAVEDWCVATHSKVPSTRDLLNPEINLEIGCWFLSRALSRWNGYASQESLALAEYNAGRTTVLKKWKPESPETPLDLDKITYPGTRDYVRQILQKRDGYHAEHSPRQSAQTPVSPRKASPASPKIRTIPRIPEPMGRPAEGEAPTPSPEVDTPFFEIVPEESPESPAAPAAPPPASSPVMESAGGAPANH